MELIGFIFIIFCYLACYKSVKNNTSLEKILKERNFTNILSLPNISNVGNRIYLSATKHSMKYLFVRSNLLVSIVNISDTELRNLQEIANKLKFDRIIFYIYDNIIPIELTKKAATYNIELWNKYGQSNFETYNTVKSNTNNSTLANELKKESAPLEHAKNGVIAQDTCHIAPSTTPIIEHPTSFFKKRGPQRL